MNLFLTKVATFLADGDKTITNFAEKLKDFFNQLTGPLLIVVFAIGTLYAIVLGVRMARADSTEKREEAKKRVINVVIGIAIIVGLILLLNLLASFLPSWIGREDIDLG